MQSKNISTDQQLLDRGWAEMVKHLDEEPVGLGKWDLPLYFIASLSILALSIFGLTHDHAVRPSQPLAQVETHLNSFDDNQGDVHLITQGSNQNQELQKTVLVDKDQPLENVVENTTKISIEKSDIQNFSSNIKSKVVQNQNSSTPAKPSQITIKSQPRGPYEVDPVIAAQLSIPIRRPNLAGNYKTNDKMVQKNHSTTTATLSHPFISRLSSVPSIQANDLVIANEQVTLENTLDLPRQRNLVPELMAGYAYSFLGKSGFNVGFGLSHNLKKAKRLSLYYGVNFSHFGSVNTANLFNNGPADSSIGVSGNGGMEEFEVGPANEAVIRVQTDAISQVGLTTSAHYKISPRLSIGVGTTFMYQKITSDHNLNTADASNLLSDDLKFQYDQFVLELEDKYRMTIDLKGSWHLTPRLSVQPYWKVQPIKSQLRTNQVGLDVSFRLL